MTERQKQKQNAIRLLCHRYSELEGILLGIDERLSQYYRGLIGHSSADSENMDDHHSLWELLAALKQLRLLATYPIDYDKIHQVIRLREGDWEKVDGIWKYKRGGLLLPGTRGATHYRWLPFQIFVLTAMYACKGWVDTEVPVGSRELLPTERNGEDGTIEDLRRLCTDFTFFAPRKTDKTGLSAYNNFLYFMLEDDDAEIYCCANSQSQSKLLYERTKSLIRQMDPNGRRIRFTATATNWREGQIRHAHLESLSAGGKAKDGLFAQLCCADEFGSAPYVNGKSDMGSLVNVVLSSMGPRREPMMFTSTTAGTITAGPFMDKLENMKQELLHELDKEWSVESMPDYDERQRILNQGDRWMILPLLPDDWQLDEEYLLTSKAVRHKVNPTLGIIAQHSFYEEFIAKSRRDPSLMPETLSKLFNVYASRKSNSWLKPEEIRAVQTPRSIDECTAEDGWDVFVGSDFSKGDDLNGNSYLAVRWREDWGEYEYFGDMDSYISEEAVNSSPIRELWLHWEKDGHVHIVPGRTFDPAVAVNRIIELDGKGVNFMGFGYDPYNAKTVVNALTQWIVDIGLDPKDLIRPVRQNFATYSPAVKEFDYMIRRSVQTPDGKTTPKPMIHLSANPLWPYEFSCCQLAESNDGMENLKPVKANASASSKVDNIQMLLSALILHDQTEVKINK